jgi:nucleoside-diphosphate-sugar epimerase
VSFDSDPNNVIPQVLAGIRGILNSAAKEPGVKRFVFTSSSSAATSPKPNKKFTISKDTWNEEDVEAAWMPAPYGPSRAWFVYAASKTQAEQELWKYVREQKPHFVANAVLPNTNIGPLFYPTQWGSTTNWALDVYRGKSDFLPDAPPRKSYTSEMSMPESRS